MYFEWIEFLCILIFFGWAYCFSQLEIEIEGKFPLGGSLPSKEVETKWNEKESVMTYSYTPSIKGKDTTLYHRWMLALLSLTMLTVVVSFVIYNELFIHVILDRKFLLRFLSMIILAISVEDALWNTSHPCKKFGLNAFLQKQFPAMGGIFVWMAPLDYFISPALSFVVYWLSSNNLIFWWKFFVGMLVMAVIASIITQIWNKRSGREKRLDNHARRYFIIEGPGDARIALVYEINGIFHGTVIAVDGGIPVKTRYSENYNESGSNPNLLQNMYPNKITPEEILAKMFPGKRFEIKEIKKG